jgi:RNA polymerase sigma-70 factor (ECF subfamily)
MADPLEDAFVRHRAELMGTFYYVLGNLEDASDAFQETFVKCWRRRDSLDDVQDLKAWIFRVAWNTGRDFRRARPEIRGWTVHKT